MLEIVSQPNSIALSRNPMAYSILAKTSTGGAFGAQGVRGTMSVTAGFVTGDALVVRFTEPNNAAVSVTFGFATVETVETMLPIPSTGTLSDLGVYMAYVVGKLNAHPRLSPFFSFSASGTTTVTLTATAKFLDSGWAVDFEQSATSLGFPPVYNTYPALTDARPPYHKVLYEVFFEKAYNSGAFEQIAQLETYADELGFVRFDIQDIVHSAFKNSLSRQPVPHFSNSSPQKADNLRRYYVRMTERYNTPSVTNAWQYIGSPTTPNLVRLGGIAQNLWQDNPAWLASSALADSVLSWYPLGKVVGQYQPEWLAWRALNNGESVSLRVVTTNQEGVTTTYDVFENNSIILKAQETILFPVGITQFGLPNFEDVVRYQVVIKTRLSVGTYRSETYTYTIDPLYHESQRYIVWLNSFGVPQTLRCTGVFSPTNNVNRSESQRPLTPFADVATAGDVALRATTDRTMVYRSGPLRNDEIEALQELLSAEYVFEVFEEGFIPLRLIDKQFKMPETGQFLTAVEFSATPRIDYRNYANAQRFTLTNPNAENWKADDYDKHARLALALKWQ